MKHWSPGLALLLACAGPLPAVAQVSGAWHVVGSISGNEFALDCEFVPQGAALGGACTASTHQGKVYNLTRGAVTGNQVSWSYPASYLFLNFYMYYVGTLDGDRIVGTVEAEGRRGNFSAVRE